MFKVQNEKQEVRGEFSTRIEAYRFAEAIANGNAIGYNEKRMMFTVNESLPSRSDNPMKYDW